MPRLTEQERQQVCAEYLENGKSTVEVAREFGVHPSAIPQILRRYGHRPRTTEQAAQLYRKLAPAKEVEFCTRYEAGEPLKALCSEFGISQVRTPYRILRQHGIEPNRFKPLTEAQRSELCKQYTAGKNTRDIAERFGITRGNVIANVRRAGIAIRSNAEAQRQYTCNHGFFESIDSERKAYWLGFIAADGCVYHRKGRSKTLTVTLTNKDHQHLIRLQNDLDSTHSVQVAPNNGHIGSTFVVASSQLFDDLGRHGIVPKKSHTLTWPQHLRGDLLRHFLRGYFDGDGSAFVAKGLPVFSLIGNREFIDAARDYLVGTLGVRRNNLIAHGDNGSIVYYRYTGAPAIRVYEFMYQDASIFLPRKREKIAGFLADHS